MGNKQFKILIIFLIILIIIILIDRYKINKLNEKYLSILNKLDNIDKNQLLNYNKINKYNETFIIDIVLSKLDFSIKNYKIDKKENKLIIKCFNYFINLDNKNLDNYENLSYIDKIINYKQHEYIDSSHYNYKLIINNLYQQIYNYEIIYVLYLCIQHADIIINLDNKTYKIIITRFNIRKPSYDNYNIFSKIIKNIENPNYYFINNLINNNLYINELYDKYLFNQYILITGIEVNIYHYPPNNIKYLIIYYTNDIDKIIIEPIIKSFNNYDKLLCDINYQPCYHNRILINKFEGSYI